MPSLTSEASLNGIDASSPSLEDKDPILRSIMQQADIDMEEIEDDVPDSLKELHPYAQNLTLSDVDSCVQLENATFSPETRGSREKVSAALLSDTTQTNTRHSSSFTVSAKHPSSVSAYSRARPRIKRSSTTLARLLPRKRSIPTSPSGKLSS